MSSESDRLHELYKRTLARGSTTTRGRALENFVEEVFCSVSSVRLYERNVLDEDGAQEIDLVLSHYPAISNMPISDISIIIECKNDSRRTSAAEIREFGRKLRSRSLPVGILVTTAGLSGRRGQHGHRAISDELRGGVAIIVTTTAELLSLKDPSEVAMLLFERLMELKTLRGYRTI
ncbi:restriction endonuclease [Pseudonocardia adelaidensis]|uniref:Restriction endonuclease type IV Mrr domain-containing protein n=1 Tax=Pseudonocardia adelaidensis TaxID=648754 RepID=A0ABP9NCA7_9PSEU